MLHFHPNFPPATICEDCGCRECSHPNHDGSCNNPSVPLIFETCNQNLNQLWRSSHLSQYSPPDVCFGVYNPMMDLFRVLQKFNPNFPTKFSFDEKECKSIVEKFYTSPDGEDTNFLYDVLIGVRSKSQSPIPIHTTSYSNGPQCDDFEEFESYCYRTKEDYKAAIKAHRIYEQDEMDIQSRNSKTAIDKQLQKKLIQKAEKVLEISSNCLEAYNALALYKAENFEEALEYYKTAQSKLQLHYSDRAQENTKRFEKTNKHQMYHILEMRQYMRSLVGEANTLKKLGRFEEALNIYRKCEQLDSEPHEIQPDSISYVNYLYHIPECLIRLGKFKEALYFLKDNCHLLSMPSSKVLLWTFALCEFVVNKWPRDFNNVEKYSIPECYHDEYLYCNAIIPAGLTSPLVYEFLIGIRKLSDVRLSKTLRKNSNPKLVSENSQIQYCVDYLDIWLSIPGALDWALHNVNTIYAQMCISKTEKELGLKYYYPNDPFKNLKSYYSKGFFVNSSQPKTGKQLIHTAIDINDREVIRLLVSKKASIASEEQSSSLNALYYVCEQDKDEILDFFLSNSWVNIEMHPKAFEICCYLGHWKCLKVLLSYILVKQKTSDILIKTCLSGILNSTSFGCTNNSCKYCKTEKGFQHSSKANFSNCIDLLLMFGFKIESEYIQKIEDSKKKVLSDRITQIQRGRLILLPTKYGINDRSVLNILKEVNPYQKLQEAQTAEELKDIGNQEFQRGKFVEALKFYNQALEKSDHTKIAHILHSNIAQCHINLKQFSEALHHAEKGISADPTFVKCLYRKALALEGLSRKTEALEAIELALSKEPSNESFQKLKEKIKKDLLNQRTISDDEEEEERICRHCGGTRIPRICAYCGKEAKRKCGACKNVRYCSIECQKNDWSSNHKHVCKWAQMHKNAKK